MSRVWRGIERKMMMEWDIGIKRQRSRGLRARFCLCLPLLCRAWPTAQGLLIAWYPEGDGRDLLFSLWQVHGMPFLCPWVAQ